MKAGYRPDLEILEARLTPSASVHRVGSTLEIIGTASADHVWINDNGDRVSVFVEGRLKGSFSNIQSIRFAMGAGNDVVNYNVLDNQAVTRNVVGDLGAGNDRFLAEVVSKLTRPTIATQQLGVLGTQSDLRMTVTGGAGNDVADFSAAALDSISSLQFHFSGGSGNDGYRVIIAQGLFVNDRATLFFDGGSGRDFGQIEVGFGVGSGSALTETMLGGTGNDVLANLFVGSLQGKLTSSIDGGDGQDQVDNEFTLLSGSGGQLLANVKGGAGDDDIGVGLTLEITLEDAMSPAIIEAGLDGGPGIDHGTTNLNLFDIINIEQLTRPMGIDVLM